MIEKVKARNALMQQIRAFFHSRGFIEVETPVRMKIPCMEEHLDAEPSGDRWLRTSPELYHKKLLAAGAEKIFEIGKCFRQGERGDRHHPEYTMLEWYRAHTDYIGVLDDTKQLLAAIHNGGRDVPIAFSGDGLVLTVAEAFKKHAGWNPVEYFDGDRFDFDMVSKVEPALPRDRPVVLKDYPAERCALARLKPDDPRIAERWELYLGGIEIANAYSELTDAAEQRMRFETWGRRRRARGRTVYPLDEEFLQCLKNMPPAGGCALGVDRLLMVLTGAETLDAVLPFRD